MRHHRPPRLPHRLEDRIHVQGNERARVYHLGLHTLTGQLLGRLQSLVHHVRRSDDRDVAALALDFRHSQGQGVGFLRHVGKRGQGALVLQAEHGAIVPDGGDEQAFGIVGGGRHHNLQAGDVAEHRLQALRVLCGQAQPGAADRAHYDGQPRLAAEHVAHLCHLVQSLVQADAEEVHEHDLHHRPQAAGGRPHGQAEDG